VATEDQAQELHAAWFEIVSGKRARLITAAQDLDEIMERVRNARLRIANCSLSLNIVSTNRDVNDGSKAY
jgi:hypothetical protein